MIKKLNYMVCDILLQLESVKINSDSKNKSTKKLAKG